jgi:hypothetical protein
LCGQAGCKIGGRHGHGRKNAGCGLCGGQGCGACVGGAGASGLCNDPSCGLGHGHGHGRGHGGRGTGCGFCGGKGCKHCLGGLASQVHSKLSSLLASALYHPRMQWFVGAGGPVPLTPGYVPYIVATRSPRDYFAFPPRNPNDP